jgi:hypothetical protein
MDMDIEGEGGAYHPIDLQSLKKSSSFSSMRRPAHMISISCNAKRGRNRAV